MKAGTMGNGKTFRNFDMLKQELQKTMKQTKFYIPTCKKGESPFEKWN